MLQFDVWLIAVRHFCFKLFTILIIWSAFC